MAKIILFLIWRGLWGWIMVGTTAYAARPLIDLVDYHQLFSDRSGRGAIHQLKVVVIKRAIAKGLYGQSFSVGTSVWELAKELSGEDFLRLLLQDSMAAERQAIVRQIQMWNQELAQVSNFFQSSVEYQSIIQGEPWALPDLLWYYFALDRNAEDPLLPMQFRNTLIQEKGIFSTGSVLLLWPSVMYSTFFPRNFFGNPMLRSESAMAAFDQWVDSIAQVLKEYEVEQRERMAIYSLLSKIRQDPDLILSADFANSLLLEKNGRGRSSISLLLEAEKIVASKNRLVFAQFIQAELAKRPAIGRMYTELTTPAPERKNCMNFFRKLIEQLPWPRK